MPPRRRSPRIKDQRVTEPIAATPLEFVHPGTECKAARIETPQNPSSERNQRISRKLLLGTPLGANPQQSTSTGGENVKTIPVKGAPKTGQRGRGRGCGAPSARGRGASPTGAHAPVPGVVTHAAAAAVAGGGGGAGAPVAPVRNAQYIYRSPLVIVEVEDVNDMTIKCEAEHINMQRDDQNLATQFDTLTA